MGEKHVVVDSTADIITIKDEDEAHYVCSMLNSTPVRTFAYTIALAKGGVPFKRFTSWMIGSLPIPRFESNSDDCKKLIRISKRAHRAAETRNLSVLAECESAIDELTLPLFKMTKEELEALREHHQVLSGILPSNNGIKLPNKV